MLVIYRKIRHAHYLYIKRNVKKVWGARYTLGARYLSKNTVLEFGPIVLQHGVPSYIHNTVSTFLNSQLPEQWFALGCPPSSLHNLQT